MTDYAYVTQEDWDRAQAALRAVLPLIEEHVPPLSTAETMISLRDQVRGAIKDVGKYSEKCQKCVGLGKLNDADLGDTYYNEWQCPDCKGTGFAPTVTPNRE